MNRYRVNTSIGEAQRRKRVIMPRGGFLVEGAIALFLLVAISLVLLESSLNILKPRSYAIQQNMTDAYMSYEVAYANRIDFDAISTSGEWPESPAFSETTVTVGTMPGAGAITATLKRTRVEPTRLNAPGVDAVLGFDDLGIQIWELQSHLVYTVGSDEFYKSRTVVRSQ